MKTAELEHSVTAEFWRSHGHVKAFPYTAMPNMYFSAVITNSAMVSCGQPKGEPPLKVVASRASATSETA